MTDSRSFDPAINFYDATRDFPAEVATHGIPAILDIAGRGALILDVGTGSGRVSVPLLQHGANLIGCDLSLKMMGLLRSKYSSARLAQADASCLPFPDHSMDALLTCHVMHVVGPWRQALREFQRVLKPGGVYINARSERDETSPRRQIRGKWSQILAGRGIHEYRPGAKNAQELREELLLMGASCQEIPVVRFSRSYTIRSVVEGVANRVHSSSWDIPEDVFKVSLAEFLTWVHQETIDLEEKYAETVEFVLDVATFSN